MTTINFGGKRTYEALTVAELIEVLKAYPQDAAVIIGGDGDWNALTADGMINVYTDSDNAVPYIALGY